MGMADRPEHSSGGPVRRYPPHHHPPNPPSPPRKAPRPRKEEEVWKEEAGGGGGMLGRRRAHAAVGGGGRAVREVWGVRRSAGGGDRPKGGVRSRLLAAGGRRPAPAPVPIFHHPLPPSLPALLFCRPRKKKQQRDPRRVLIPKPHAPVLTYCIVVPPTLPPSPPVV